LPKDILYRFEK